MKFSNHFLLVTAAVLVVFANQSEAGLWQSIGNIAKDTASAFKESFLNALAEGKQHNDSQKTKLTIKQQAIEAKRDSSNNEAIDIVLKGLNVAINEIGLAADAVYDALKEARSRNYSSAEVSQILNLGFGAANKNIITAGTQAYLAVGAATKISKAGARRGLNIVVQIITDSGKVGFGGLDAAKDLAMQGVAAGNDAMDKAFAASCSAVQAIEKTLFNFVIKESKLANEAIKDESRPVPLNTEAVAETSESQNAIESIQKECSTASSGVFDINKLEAIRVVCDGTIGACKTIAKAGEIAYNGLNEAKNSLSPESAVATINKAFAASKKQCVVAVSENQQALGIVAKIIGKQAEKSIIPAMEAAEKARVGLLSGLENTELVVVNGIENNAINSALSFGRDGVASAGENGYTNVEKSVKLALKAIISSN